MSSRKQFKVISPIKDKHDKTHWTRVGSAFLNTDDSINVYLDAFPKSFQLQIREMDEEDRQRRDEARARLNRPTSDRPGFGPRDAGGGAGTANESTPF